jgi:hypothetical protein
MPPGPCGCGCGLPVGKGRRRFATEDCRRRARRHERVREPSEYTRALLRMLKTARLKRGFDADSFAEMVQLDTQLHVLLAEGAMALYEDGFSWGEIGRACGMSRQAARQRWGTK